MANTTKKQSTSDFEQAMEYAFNDNTRTLGTSSFVVSKVNHELNFVDASPTVQQIQYMDEGVVLFTLQITYADATRASVTNVKRIT
jgi:hypothetical protein